MLRNPMSCLFWGLLLLLIPDACAIAQPIGDGLECLWEQSAEVSSVRKELSSSKAYTVPRKQVLLEIATATW